MTGIHLYAQVSSCAAAQRQHRLSAPQIPLQHSELLVQEISPALQIQTNTLEAAHVTAVRSHWQFLWPALMACGIPNACGVQ